MAGSGPVGAARSGGAVFGLVVGLLLGVLISALVMPVREEVRTVERGGEGTEPVSAAAGPVPGVAQPGDAALPHSTVAAPSDEAAPGAALSVASSGGSGNRTVQEARAPASSSGGGRSAATGIGDGFPVKGDVGIDDDTIRIGIALLDTTALGPVADQGTPEDHYDARLAAWKREGLLPVHGRNVEFVYRRYNVLSQEEQRAACKYLVQDKKTFMVIATVFFRVGGECVAKENQRVLFTSDATNETALARSHPYFFAIAMSDDRVMRNLAHWAHHKGYIKGRAGMYYNNSDPIEVDLVKKFKGELERLGYRNAVEATTNTNESSQNDLLAVRRFQQEDVKVVFLFTSRAGFTQAAESQNYRPRYLESDHNYGTTETSSAAVPPAQYDSTLAMTGRRGGEHQAGLPHTREQAKCLADFKAHTGKTPKDDTFEFQMIMHSCDTSNSILLALQRIGRNVNRETFIAALESFRDVPMARSGHASFSPGKHHGVDRYRTLQWQGSCRCWKAISDFEPLFVP